MQILKDEKAQRVLVLTEIMMSVMLASCGGGGAGGAEDASAAAADAVMSTGADGKAQAQAVKTTPASTTTWTKVANDGQAFTVTGTQTARYGTGSTWKTATVTGTGQCTQGFFGGDPAPGLAKECDISSTAPAPAPAPTPAPTPAPAPAPVGSWTKKADEGGTFTVPTSSTVRYGAKSSWIQKVVSGTVSCSNTFFGNDPLYGTKKECDLLVTAAAPAPAPTSGIPYVDVTKIPTPNVGYSTPRIQPARVADPSQNPAPGDGFGAFRDPCDFSHMAFDDPIVYPGQPGKSHLHVFFGNTGTDANTTPTSLVNSGNSTCAGGTLNRTAYWAPAIIDTKNGAPVKPSSSIFYYKTGEIIAANTVKAMPPGLRMVAGDPKNATPNGPFRYACVGPAETYWNPGNSIPNCLVGSDMIMEVAFPQCWDGVNLDSPDHKSHMGFPTGAGVCPAAYPVPIPLITLEIHYTITVANSQLTWRLSSDAYDPSLPAGYSGHGDWMNGWDPSVEATWIKYCENAAMDCHALLLGDGNMLY